MLAVAAITLSLTSTPSAQTFSRGVPASVSSPESDGRQHGVPASVVSPVPVVTHGPRRPEIHLRGPLHRFGPQQPHRNVVVPVPIFYPIYYGEGNVADPYVAPPTDATAQPAESDVSNDVIAYRERTAREDELRQAYLQGAREAMAQERDSSRSASGSADHARPHSQAMSDPAPRRARVEDVSEPPKEDNSPLAVFIFKDGHKLEIKNFAIMGATLYDLSGGTVKKVKIAELDKDATVKANDDRGIQVKIP